MKRRLGPLVTLTLLALGCGEARLLDGFTGEGQTRLRLSPSEFVGAVPCRRGLEGALQSYIARLQVRVTGAPADAGLETAFTTGVVACDSAALFPVSAGREYAAEIFGFDRAVTGTVDLATARWTASCGTGRSLFDPTDAGPAPLRPTLALRGSTVPMRGCTTFDDVAPGGPSQLLIDQESALDALRCGQEPGEVATLRAALGAATAVAACGAPLRISVPEPGRYTIELQAFEGTAPGQDAAAPPGADAAATPEAPPADAGAGDGGADPLDASAAEPPLPEPGAAPSGVPRWSTRCVGQALPGLAAPAFCEPLAPLP